MQHQTQAETTDHVSCWIFNNLPCAIIHSLFREANRTKCQRVFLGRNGIDIGLES